MHLERSKDAMAYMRNIKKARVVTMTLAEFYDQLNHPSGSNSQAPHVPARAYDFIQLDPFYGATHHPSSKLLKKYRKLFDACSKVGTVLVIWGHFRELADYQRLLEGGYSSGSTTRWHVDPSLLTMVRAYLRNYVAALGPLMKRQTDTALVALRVEPREKKRAHAVRNGTAELERLELEPGNAFAKLSVNSNVVLDHHPPTAAQLLKGEDGMPLRKMAEKGSSANTILVARFLPPNGSMLCLMSGTASSALPVILRGDESTWTGVEMDADVAELSTHRIGKAWLLRARHAAENTGSLATIMAIQSLASEPTAFIMPEHNIPLALKHGAPLTANPADNFEFAPDQQEPRFEVKATNMNGHLGLQLGDGVYLRSTATAIPAGSFLPDLDFYGSFFLSETTDTKYPEGSPQHGIFQLSAPLAHYSMEISPKCPGCKINDAMGAQHNTHTQLCALSFYCDMSRRHWSLRQRGGGAGRTSCHAEPGRAHADPPHPQSGENNSARPTGPLQLRRLLLGIHHRRSRYHCFLHIHTPHSLPTFQAVWFINRCPFLLLPRTCLLRTMMLPHPPLLP